MWEEMQRLLGNTPCPKRRMKMSSKKWFKRLKGKLALMLAIILMFPNTAVAQWIGAGVVTAKAETVTITASASRSGTKYTISGSLSKALPDGKLYYDYIDTTGSSISSENFSIYREWTHFVPLNDNTDFSFEVDYCTIEEGHQYGFILYAQSAPIEASENFYVYDTGTGHTNDIKIPITIGADDLGVSYIGSPMPWTGHTPNYKPSKNDFDYQFKTSNNNSRKNKIFEFITDETTDLSFKYKRLKDGYGEVTDSNVYETLNIPLDYEVYISSDSSEDFNFADVSFGTVTVVKGEQTVVPDGTIALSKTGVTSDKDKYIVTANVSELTNGSSYALEYSFNDGEFSSTNTYEAGENEEVVGKYRFAETGVVLPSTPVVSATFTTPAATAKPTITSSSGTTFITDTLDITLGGNTYEKPTRVYYTTDGTTPTLDSDWVTASGTITIDDTTTVKAFALENERIMSGVEEKTFTKGATVNVSGITVSPKTGKIGVNETLPLSTTFSPSNATENPTVTWTSGNSSIAAVDSSGVVTGKSAGSTTITASVTSNGRTYSDTCNVSVIVKATGLSIEPASTSVNKNDTKQLTAKFTPANQTEFSTVTWTSGNSNIATVSSTGLVTGKSAGTTTITAKAGTHTATCSLEVTNNLVEVTGITISPDPASVKKGKTKQLTAAFIPANQTEDPTITWTSGNTGIATVNSSGVVTGVAEGSTTITASIKGGTITDTCEVEVTDDAVKVTGMSISPNPASVVKGKTAQLTAVFAPADQTEDPDVTWISGNKKVATVDSTGLVTGVAAGNATVIASINSGAITAECEVTVTEDVVKVTGMSINPNPATVLKGKTVQLTAAFAPAEQTENPTVTWTSGNTGIATVDSTGLVTGVKAGSTTVTASINSGAITATCSVEVTETMVEMTGISVSPNPAEVEEGKTAQLTATLAPSNQTENPTVTWTSLNTSIATVDSTGLVTGVKEGSTTITAKVTGSKGEFSDSVTVNVKKVVIPVSDIKINKTSVNIKEGDTESLTAEIIPQNATEKAVTWKSANTGVATVTSAGLVTGVKAGVTTVTATCGSFTAACMVNVTKADVMPGEGDENPDLTNLINDTEGGNDLEKVINDVVTTTVTEDGEVVTETKIWVGGLKSSYTYTGAKITPKIHVYDGLRELSEGDDYSVKYYHNTDVGKDALVKVGFRGKYSSTPPQEINFNIVPAVFGTDVIAQDTAVKSKKGKEVVPSIKVVWKSTKKNIDSKYYSITYTDAAGKKVSAPTTAGIYTACITPVNKLDCFTGSMSVKVTVIDDDSRNLAGGKVRIANNKKVWTGQPIVLKSDEITVIDANKKTVDPKYYTVSYLGNHTDPGKATVVVTANDSRSDGYVGSVTGEFTIKKGKNSDDLSFTIEDSVSYAKGGATAKVTVIDKSTNTVLVEGKDYKVSYSNNKEIDTTKKAAVATVKGKGQYKFTKELNYMIVPMSIRSCCITVNDVTSSKKWNKPKILIKDNNGKKLGKKDYKITAFKVNGKAITAAPEVGSEITVTLEGNNKTYSGEIDMVYRLINSSEDISGAKVKKEITKEYEGGPVTLTAKDMEGWLEMNNVSLEYGKNFTVIGYEANTAKGTAKVTVRGIAGKSPSGKDLILGGTKIITFKIKEKKGKWNPEGEALIGGEWK